VLSPESNVARQRVPTSGFLRSTDLGDGALYAGLRCGELMALRWDNVDLAVGVIRVERAYDDKSRVEVEPKSRAGRWTVPIVGALRDVLT
jgi:integrase